jgi:hypothetical protein
MRQVLYCLKAVGIKPESLETHVSVEIFDSLVSLVVEKELVIEGRSPISPMLECYLSELRLGEFSAHNLRREE